MFFAYLLCYNKHIKTTINNKKRKTKMKINLNDEKKINETLRMVAGDASRYMIMDGDELKYYRKEAEELAKTWKLNKNELKGLRISIESASSTYAKSYESACTWLVLQRGVKDWFLVKCEKTYRSSKSPERFVVVATAEQQKLAVERCFPAYKMQN
tara:strand:- start:1750 stop:2217 length:468 start_codon:yes stop_codon:yes gene_type:complete